MLALLRAAYAGGANNDTHLAASMEQALPLQPDWLNFNRFCVRGEQSVPLFKGLRARISGKGAALPPLYHLWRSLLATRIGLHCRQEQPSKPLLLLVIIPTARSAQISGVHVEILDVEP